MIAILMLFRSLLGSLFKSSAQITAENLLLRHQLNIARRYGPRRARLSNWDRWGLVLVYRMVPNALNAVSLVRPETVIRWHRQGFRAFWRWKSRPSGGRPRIPQELRDLVREMSRANPLWGAPRIHGELLKLGIEVSQSTVANYMPRCSRPPSQSWKTFLRNHAPAIMAIDVLVVPTVSFKLLYCLVVLGHDRRQLLSFGITAHPTAAWLGCQITEAFPWDERPRYLIRDRDGIYGEPFRYRLRAMGRPLSRNGGSLTSWTPCDGVLRPSSPRSLRHGRQRGMRPLREGSAQDRLKFRVNLKLVDREGLVSTAAQS